MVGILKSEVETWKQWRLSYPEIVVDFRAAGTGLSRADLIGANLHGANVRRTVPVPTNMFGTKLSRPGQGRRG